MFTVINFIISISKTFLSHVQDYADELLTPLTILDESGTALPNAQEQFKVMLKGPGSLKSYLGLPFNVLQVSRRALIAYSPNQFPWNLLYLQFKVMLKGPPFNASKVFERALNASYYIGRIWNGTAKRSSAV